MQKCKNVILTGPPGSGKTTLLNRLRGMGKVVDEVARDVIREWDSGDKWGRGKDVQDEIYKRTMKVVDRSLGGGDEWVIFDRTHIDCMAYGYVPDKAPEPIKDAEVWVLKFHPEWYANDSQRKETMEEAIAIGERLRGVYEDLGYSVREIDSADPTTWPDWARKKFEKRANLVARVAAAVILPDPYDMTRDEFLRGTPAPRARGGHRLLYHETSLRNAASIVRGGLRAKNGEIWASKKPDGFYGKGGDSSTVVFQVPKDDPLVRSAGASMIVYRDVEFKDIVMVDPYIEETGKRLSELRDGRYAEKYWDKYFDGTERRAAVAGRVAARVLRA